MTKKRESSSELGVWKEEVSIHKGGDCTCGNNHISERMYLGFSLCLICQNLSKAKKRPRKATDAFSRCRRRMSRSTIGPVDRAIGYVGAWLGPEGKAWVRSTFERKGSWEAWAAAFHDNFGMEVRNALRKIGYHQGVFGVRTLDDVYLVFLAKAVGLEVPE